MLTPSIRVRPFGDSGCYEVDLPSNECGERQCLPGRIAKNDGFRLLRTSPMKRRAAPDANLVSLSDTRHTSICLFVVVAVRLLHQQMSARAELIYTAKTRVAPDVCRLPEHPHTTAIISF